MPRSAGTIWRSLPATEWRRAYPLPRRHRLAYRAELCVGLLLKRMSRSMIAQATERDAAASVLPDALAVGAAVCLRRSNVRDRRGMDRLAAGDTRDATQGRPGYPASARLTKLRLPAASTTSRLRSSPAPTYAP
jgi:hypothetical protein